MKKISVMLSAILLAASLGASAQSTSSDVLVKDCEGYNRVSFSYASLSMTSKISSFSTTETMPGFKFGWLKGISVSQELPFFVEAGLDFSYNTKSEKVQGIKMSSSTAAIAIPVNATYKLAFKNGLYLAPYFGLHFKVNVLGKEKMSYGGESASSSWFSKDDMDDETYNRFQMGWQSGLNLGYKMINLNIGYMGDFMPLYKEKESDMKIKTGGFVVGVGFNF